MKKQLLAGLIATTLSSPLLAVEVSDQLEVFGTLELEYGASRGDSGNDYGTALATGALGATIKPNDKFDITTSWLYEEGLHEVETPLEIDEAMVTWHAMPDEKLDITAGKKYLPFGKFESAMVSDPLTLELGETRMDKVLEASGTNGNIDAGVYAFEGEAEDGYGARVGYSTETARVGVDYLSSLLDSEVPAIGVNGSVNLGRVTLLGEHVTASKSFKAGDLDGAITTDAKPSATHLEADIDLNNDRTVAVAWNKTKNAEEIGLAREYYGAAYRQPIYKDISGAIELVQSKQYTGEKDKTFTAQLSYEF
ncbi:MAG: LbtU family siderophore porin [Gammaproteobacteria bacterium]|nr:LbtU family siderophore porin [Gammaproteobacteria bacterium]MBU1723448.1 LbtU family siderophore porin [Gammaproteobacteria bacterium]MBU2003759.1 LbtU family siderophore porin [Gammaproteobacteria bacterium]